MSEHTNEPWSCAVDSNGKEWGVDAGMWGIATCADEPGNGTPEANARRIVACVNAFAEFHDTSIIEDMLAGGFSVRGLSKYAKGLEQQRDELLSALKAARSTLERENKRIGGPIADTIWHTDCETLFDFMDAAIAKAEGIEDKPETYDCPIHGNLGEESCPRC